jgi:phosphatidylethanolamine/phosphatidyl-N-methylethanolamine N-methyltransferase
MQLLAKLKLNAPALFVQELLNNPKQIGAVLPSSRNLAVAMAKWLPHNSEDYALELGPGTGAVSQALIERGLREERLIAIERSPKLADHLRVRFPRAKIITGDAFELDRLLQRNGCDAKRISTVISSLPLMNFEARIAHDLARKIRAVLPAGGKLVQYTYRIGRTPKAAAHFDFVATDVVWLNCPPARVSVYQK